MSKLKLITAASLIPVLLGSTNVYADGEPKLFGNMNAAFVDGSTGDDRHMQSLEAALGVKGFYKGELSGGQKISYKLEVEFTDTINTASGSNEIDVKNAVIALPFSYGTFVFAPYVESGQQKELYGGVDIFDVYEANRLGGLFDQPDEASGVFAYVTPKFGGSFQAKFATLNLGTANDDNNQDIDASAWRVLYNSGNISAGLGNVQVTKEVTGAAKDISRTAVNFKYDFGQGHVAVTHEMVEDHPATDWDTTGVAVRYDINSDYQLNVGMFSQSGDKENKASIINLSRKWGKVGKLYLEHATFDDPDLGYLSVGTKVSFNN